jgi:hypothetical protein
MTATITRTRWLCDQHDTPILLGIVTSDGTLEIKVGDRLYLVTGLLMSGTVSATCPSCGAIHVLDLRGGAA